MHAKDLLEQSCDATGLDDFGEASFAEGLDRLVDSLNNEAALTEFGGALVEGELGSYLRDRLQIIDYRRAHPEISEADIVPPVVIIGQGRTGTTILHDLLAQDPDSRVPITWEV